VSVFLVLAQPASVSSGVVAAVNRFTDFLLQYAIALAAVGALAMALIEAWKKLFDSRTKFQARKWIQWVERSAFDASILGIPADSVGPGASSVTRVAALAELLQLSTGVSRQEADAAAHDLLASHGELSRFHGYEPPPAHALFALDLGRMMGSIQETADVALTSPRQNPSLYLLMTMGADPDDIRQWSIDGASSMPDIANTAPTADDRKRVKDYADRFARLRQIVKRKLDGFQLYTGDRWASRNQLQANVVGMIIMFGVLWWMRGNLPGISRSLGVMVVLSLLGGILSPVAKDLVSALKRVKDG
jgi:hypothetical protein